MGDAGFQEWTETTFYDVDITNPCHETIIYPDETAFDDILYYVEDTRANYAFTAVSDSIANSIDGGSCGAFIYSFASNDTAIGTFMLEYTELISGPAVSIQTDSETAVGNYTITVNVVMEEYLTQTTSFEFHLQIDPPYVGPEGIETISDTSVAPILNNFEPNYQLIIGEAWDIYLEPFDENDDLALVKVEAGRAGTFVEYDDSAFRMFIEEDSPFVSTGNYIVVVQLVDADENGSEYAIILEIECPTDGSDSIYAEC